MWRQTMESEGRPGGGPAARTPTEARRSPSGTVAAWQGGRVTYDHVISDVVQVVEAVGAGIMIVGGAWVFVDYARSMVLTDSRARRLPAAPSAAGPGHPARSRGVDRRRHRTDHHRQSHRRERRRPRDDRRHPHRAQLLAGSGGRRGLALEPLAPDSDRGRAPTGRPGGDAPLTPSRRPRDRRGARVPFGPQTAAHGGRAGPAHFRSSRTTLSRCQKRTATAMTTSTAAT